MAVTVNLNMKNKNLFSSLTASDLISSGTRQLILDSLTVDPIGVFQPTVVIPPVVELDDEPENFDEEAEILEDLDEVLPWQLEDLDVSDLDVDLTFAVPSFTLETTPS